MPRCYFPFIGVIFVHIGLIASALVIVRCIRDPLRLIIKSCQPPAEYPIGETHLQGCDVSTGHSACGFIEKHTTANVASLQLESRHRCVANISMYCRR